MMTRMLTLARVCSSATRIVVGLGMMVVLLSMTPRIQADPTPSESMAVTSMRLDMSVQALSQRVDKLEDAMKEAHWQSMSADLANLRESVKSAYTMLWTLAVGLAVQLLSGLPSLLIARLKGK